MIEPRVNPVRPPPSPSEDHWPRRWLGSLTRIAVGVLVGFVLINLGLLLLANIPLEDVEQAQSALDRWAFVLFLFRLSLYWAIWRHWTPVTVWFARRHHWRRAEFRRILEKRPEMLSYFILLELIISGSFLIRVFS